MFEAQKTETERNEGADEFLMMGDGQKCLKNKVYYIFDAIFKSIIRAGDIWICECLFLTTW